jgi:glycosyltransferase involved in cell wall biosynthesis
MELPIICSSIEGNIDIVQQSSTGLLFEKGNSQQLLEQISYALQHPARMQEMAAQLYEVVQANYKRENIWQNILKEYQSLLNLKH